MARKPIVWGDPLLDEVETTAAAPGHSASVVHSSEKAKRDQLPSGIIPIIHDSPEWHALRAKHVGGSEIAALFDLPPEARPKYLLTRFALWHIKRGSAPPPTVEGPRPYWGLQLEAAIAEAAAGERHLSLGPGGYAIDPTTAGLGCTLDYVVREPGPLELELGFSGPGVLEIKNVDWLIHRKRWRDGGTDEPPLPILLQLQHQLAATGYSWGLIAALVGGNDPHYYPYAARPTLIAEIRRRVSQFWQSVRAGREPSPDESDGTAEVLRHLYAPEDDEPLDLDGDPEFAAWCRQYQRASAEKKAAEQRQDEAKHNILAKLGNHARAFSLGYLASVSAGVDRPDRLAKPGEIIRGRRGARTLRVREMVEL